MCCKILSEEHKILYVSHIIFYRNNSVLRSMFSNYMFFILFLCHLPYQVIITSKLAYFPYRTVHLGNVRTMSYWSSQHSRSWYIMDASIYWKHKKMARWMNKRRRLACCHDAFVSVNYTYKYCFFGFRGPLQTLSSLPGIMHALSAPMM